MPSQLAEAASTRSRSGKNSQPIRAAAGRATSREAVLYLASDGSDWVTGQALTVDGGITLGPSGGSRELSVFAPIVQALGVDARTLAAMAQGKGVLVSQQFVDRGFGARAFVHRLTITAQ